MYTRAARTLREYVPAHRWPGRSRHTALLVLRLLQQHEEGIQSNSEQPTESTYGATVTAAATRKNTNMSNHQKIRNYGGTYTYGTTSLTRKDMEALIEEIQKMWKH